MKKLFISVIFFSLLIVSKNSYAQWGNDPNQNLRISNFGYFVDACEDGMGGAFVGWMTGNTSYPTVWLQWIDRYGYVKWDTPLQLKGEGEAQGGFKLIKSDIGKVIVYFGDNKIVAIPPPPYPGPIYEGTLLMQKIDTTGRLIWGDKGTKITTTKSIPDSISFNALDIVSAGDYGAYITWTYGYGKYHDDSTVTRIQKINKDGQRLWGDEGKYITTWYGVNAPSPSLGERKPEGVFLLYYKENHNITIASINPDMNIRWEKTNKWYPLKKIVPDDSGGAAWARTVYPEIWDSGYTLIANRINANGDLLWSDSGIVIEKNLKSGSLFNLHLKFLKDESFLILYGNYLQNVKKNGEIVFPNGKFFYGDFANTNRGLEIIQSDSSNFIITWHSTRYGSDEYLCQKFSSSFEKLWDHDDLFSRYTHEELALIPDGRGGFIDAFSVYYPATPGVLIQQVSSNGVLGEVLTTIKENNISDPENFRLYQNFPNPFNPTTQIQYVLPNASNVIVTVYNSLGQTVKVFNEGTKEAGNHNITFNGEGLSSGIYLYSVHSGSIDGKQSFTAARKMLLIR
jgi:hypothetical protein